MYYTGKTASGYDAKRQNDPKWKFETETVKKLLGQIEIKSAIDAPVGTGRFFDILPSYTIGYDISQEMLDIAAKKHPKAKLIKRDILREDFTTMADLVISIRFLNLLNEPDFYVALGKLLSGARKYAIFTLRTAPKPISLGRVTVHATEDAFDAIAANGFEIVESHKYMKDGAPGDYKIYLCKRAKTRKKRDNHITDDNTEPDSSDRTLYSEPASAGSANLLVDGEEADTYRAEPDPSPAVPAGVGCPSCNSRR